MHRWMALGVAVTASLAFLGCAEEEYAPTFAADSGQGVLAEDAYPEGPYGIELGETLPDLQFYGYVDSTVELHTGYKVISLADFYNPTGNELYAEGSLFPAGAPKPKALMITSPAMWCQPCQYEADVLLPPRYAQYKPLGGEFLAVMADNGAGTAAANLTNLDYWAGKYDVNYPIVVDPDYSLGPAFQDLAFPANFIIDTRTMRIVVAIVGTPPASFWADYKAVIDGTFEP